jgi:hypothetical protein
MIIQTGEIIALFTEKIINIQRIRTLEVGPSSIDWAQQVIILCGDKDKSPVSETSLKKYIYIGVDNVQKKLITVM